MSKRTVLFMAIFVVCIGLLDATGCQRGAQHEIADLEEAIIGTWELDGGRTVLTFNEDGTFDGILTGTSSFGGTYSVKGDLLFVDNPTDDVYLVYQFFRTFDGGLISDDARSAISWNAVS